MSVISEHRRFPLFIHIFAAMLCAIFVAQLLSVSMIFFTRPPTPGIVSIDEIAAALQSESAQSGIFDVSPGMPPLEEDQDGRDRELRTRLATKLNVVEPSVRLVMSRPPWLLDFKPMAGGPDPERNGRDERDRNLDMVVGGFVAALMLPDGQWRIVRPEHRLFEPWQIQFVSWFAGALAAVIPLAWLASRRVAAPIRQLASAAERIGHDPNAPFLKLEGPSEVVVAAAALNGMQARLKKYVENRTTMVAAIAHDLRTPLMRLALYLDDVPEPLRTAAEAEIFEMRDRIQATLDFVQNINRPARRQRMSLLSLIESVVDGLADLGMDVHLEASDDVVINADAAGLRALFTNLLNNAVQYAQGARVRLSRSDSQAIVEVMDRGPGIDVQDLERVFEPFYRVERSRNRDSGGTGLGLSSARAVARAHGGDVELLNREGGGLVARVTLPV